MKHNVIIIIGLVICINNCRLPADPIGKINIIKRLDTIDTGGNCLDLDVDIIDSVLVAAANYNGYFIYKINSTNGIVSNITEQKHIGPNEMDTNLGDNRAQSVTLSKEHNIAFVMDKYDHIWLYKYEDGAIQYDMPNYLEEECYGSTWLSVAIDDQLDRIGVYTLLKHNAAEEDVGEFLEYSTSLVWTNLHGIDLLNTNSEQLDPNCEYIINQGSVVEKIYFADTLLTQSFGELGVKVFKKTEDDICLTNSGLIDLNSSQVCINHLYPAGSENAGEINYGSCCEADGICPENLIDPNTGECAQYFLFGHGGKYASAGGIMPEIYAEFDTPGEVEAIFSERNTIFAGLKYANGCVFVQLDDDGNIINMHQFAVGYSVYGIHQDNGLLALAVGNDGIILFNWDGSNVSFIGKIETPFANNVKVVGDIIFVATEDGIDIIQIDY